MLLIFFYRHKENVTPKTASPNFLGFRGFSLSVFLPLFHLPCNSKSDEGDKGGNLLSNDSRVVFVLLQYERAAADRGVAVSVVHGLGGSSSGSKKQRNNR